MIYLIFVIVLLFFTGAALYSLIMSGHVARKGRQVDVRVLSCEEVRPGDAGPGESGSCYEVTVDFYGMKGEEIKKTFFSQTSHEVGSVIRSRYLDKRGRLYPGVSEDEGKSNRLSGILILGVCVLMLALVLFLWWLDGEYEGEMPQWFIHGFGYFISILFIIVGVSGIVRWKRLEKRAADMQVLEGVQISFREEWSTDSDGDRIRIYYPVYEYELMGEKRRYESRMGGSAKKFRQVGRKVHMMRDYDTDQVYCREDEKSSFGMQMIFGVVGFLTLLLMLYLSFGSVEAGNGSGTGHVAGGGTAGGNSLEEPDRIITLTYHYTDQNAEVCSWWIDIYADLSGRLLLFPNRTVEGKGIEQEITFTVSENDGKRLSEWAARYPDTSPAVAGWDDTKEAMIYVTVYMNGESIQGGGYQDEALYAKIYNMFREAVPGNVWKELRERETAYYDN